MALSDMFTNEEYQNMWEQYRKSIFPGILLLSPAISVEQDSVRLKYMLTTTVRRFNFFLPILVQRYKERYPNGAK